MRSEISKLPAIFLDRLKRILPAGKFDQIANTFSDTKPTTFRVNPLKGGVAQLIREELEAKGFRLETAAVFAPCSRHSFRSLFFVHFVTSYFAVSSKRNF